MAFETFFSLFPKTKASRLYASLKSINLELTDNEANMHGLMSAELLSKRVIYQTQKVSLLEIKLKLDNLYFPIYQHKTWRYLKLQQRYETIDQKTNDALNNCLLEQMNECTSLLSLFDFILINLKNIDRYIQEPLVLLDKVDAFCADFIGRLTSTQTNIPSLTTLYSLHNNVQCLMREAMGFKQNPTIKREAVYLEKLNNQKNNVQTLALLTNTLDTFSSNFIYQCGLSRLSQESLIDYFNLFKIEMNLLPTTQVKSLFLRLKVLPLLDSDNKDLLQKCQEIRLFFKNKNDTKIEKFLVSYQKSLVIKIVKECPNNEESLNAIHTCLLTILSLNLVTDIENIISNFAPSESYSKALKKIALSIDTRLMVQTRLQSDDDLKNEIDSLRQQLIQIALVHLQLTNDFKEKIEGAYLLTRKGFGAEAKMLMQTLPETYRIDTIFSSIDLKHMITTTVTSILNQKILAACKSHLGNKATLLATLNDIAKQLTHFNNLETDNVRIKTNAKALYQHWQEHYHYFVCVFKKLPHHEKDTNNIILSLLQQFNIQNKKLNNNPLVTLVIDLLCTEIETLDEALAAFLRVRVFASNEDLKPLFEKIVLGCDVFDNTLNAYEQLRSKVSFTHCDHIYERLMEQVDTADQCYQLTMLPAFSQHHAMLFEKGLKFNKSHSKLLTACSDLILKKQERYIQKQEAGMDAEFDHKTPIKKIVSLLKLSVKNKHLIKEASSHLYDKRLSELKAANEYFKKAQNAWSSDNFSCSQALIIFQAHLNNAIKKTLSAAIYVENPTPEENFYGYDYKSPILRLIGDFFKDKPVIGIKGQSKAFNIPTQLTELVETIRNKPQFKIAIQAALERLKTTFSNWLDEEIEEKKCLWKQEFIQTCNQAHLVVQKQRQEIECYCLAPEKNKDNYLTDFIRDIQQHPDINGLYGLCINASIERYFPEDFRIPDIHQFWQQIELELFDNIALTPSDLITHSKTDLTFGLIDDIVLLGKNTLTLKASNILRGCSSQTAVASYFSVINSSREIDTQLIMLLNQKALALCEAHGNNQSTLLETLTSINQQMAHFKEVDNRAPHLSNIANEMFLYWQEQHERLASVFITLPHQKSDTHFIFQALRKQHETRKFQIKNDLLLYFGLEKICVESDTLDEAHDAMLNVMHLTCTYDISSLFHKTLKTSNSFENRLMICSRLMRAAQLHSHKKHKMQAFLIGEVKTKEQYWLLIKEPCFHVYHRSLCDQSMALNNTQPQLLRHYSERFFEYCETSIEGAPKYERGKFDKTEALDVSHALETYASRLK